MDDLRNFKNIADEMMSDIKVSDELKEKTLQRCAGKRMLPVQRTLLPLRRVLLSAAGVILAVGLLGTYHILPLQKNDDQKNASDIGILSEAGEDIALSPNQTADTAVSIEDGYQEWMLNSADQAGSSFGADFLLPAYLPGGFELNQIQASGVDKSSADKIILSYFSGDHSFLILEEKADQQDIYNNFDSITINGLKGYIKAVIPEGTDTGNMDTELHWFNEGVHYCVSGQISKKEATKIAEAME